MKHACLGTLLWCLAAIAPSTSYAERWSIDKANHWSEAQGWIVGANYIPSNAVNQLEMWQADTFDPLTIDRELGWAEAIGMRTLRVFLHDLVWQEDEAGFLNRINTFLAIAEKHKIKPIFVIFDACWDPSPKTGRQPEPRPGVHNSRWVQSPSLKALLDIHEQDRLHAYITDLITAFAQDSRILAWDVWNEPENMNEGTYNDNAPAKTERIEALLPLVFQWAREAQPLQPLTSGLTGDWPTTESLDSIQKTQITQSDIISFHDYDEPAQFEASVKNLLVYHRPLFCTEYMARSIGSTFENIMPIAKKYGVSLTNWGFAAGKTQTYLPWDSWGTPYATMPKPWFHDIFYPNGRPYKKKEIAFIKRMTER